MFEYLLALVSGVVVKIVDWLDDDKKSNHPLKYLLAALYGVAIGCLVGTSPFAMLFLGALFAQVFARKVDTTAHQLGFAVALISLVYFGFPQLDLVLFLFFMIAAFLDEAEYTGMPKLLTTYRPVLPASALLVALVTGRLEFLAGVLVFDVGYLAVPVFTGRFTEKRQEQPKRERRKRR